MDGKIRKAFIKVALANPSKGKQCLRLYESLRIASSYKEYVLRKKQKGEDPLSKEDWETKVHGAKDSEGSGAGSNASAKETENRILSNPNKEEAQKEVQDSLKEAGEGFDKAHVNTLAKKSIKDKGFIGRAEASIESVKKVYNGKPISKEEKSNLVTAGGACLIASVVGLPFMFPAAVVFFASSAFSKSVNAEGSEKPEGSEKQASYRKRAADEKEMIESFARKIITSFGDFMKNLTPEESAKVLEEAKKRKSKKG